MAKVIINKEKIEAIREITTGPVPHHATPNPIKGPVRSPARNSSQHQPRLPPPTGKMHVPVEASVEISTEPRKLGSLDEAFEIIMSRLLEKMSYVSASSPEPVRAHAENARIAADYCLKSLREILSPETYQRYEKAFSHTDDSYLKNRNKKTEEIVPESPIHMG